MKKYYYEQSQHRRFTHLLCTLLLLPILLPIVYEFQIKAPVVQAIFLFVLLITLHAVTTSFKHFVIASCIAFISFLLNILNQMEFSFFESKYIGLLSGIISVIFVLFAVVLLTKGLFARKRISSDTIRGGICIYLLLALLWGQIYQVIYLFDANAFSQQPMNFLDFNYFSFATLTTLGYGDIVPLNYWSKNLTSLEAVVGQMFLAIFVARLIGLHIVQERS